MTPEYSYLFYYFIDFLFLFKINYMQTAKELMERLPNDLDRSKDTTLHSTSLSLDMMALSVKFLLLFRGLKFHILLLRVR